MTDKSNLLSDLARSKALFQQRAVTAALGIWPAGSKPDQEPLKGRVENVDERPAEGGTR